MRNSFDQERELAREAIDQQRQMERVAREERRHSLRCAMASYGEKVLEPMAAVRDFMIAGDLGVVIDRAIHASEELAKARLRMQRIESHLHALSFDMIDAYNLLEDQIAEASKYVARARTMAEQGSIEPLAKYAPLVESTRTSIGTSLVGIVPEGPEKQHIEQTIANTGMKG
jgi:hypothetical protein